MTGSSKRSKCQKKRSPLWQLRLSLRGCLVSVPFVSDWKQGETRLEEQVARGKRLRTVHQLFIFNVLSLNAAELLLYDYKR